MDWICSLAESESLKHLMIIKGRRYQVPAQEIVRHGPDFLHAHGITNECESWDCCTDGFE